MTLFFAFSTLYLDTPKEINMRNHLTASIIVLLTGASILFTTTPCLSAPHNDPVGWVVAVRGIVKAVSPKKGTRQLKMKSPVFEEDSLVTENRSRIQLLFTDNTIMSLGEKTQMKISEYRWSKNTPKDAAMKTEVKEGTFRILGGVITKTAPQNFTTATPAATIGIRGSSYAGNVTNKELTVVMLGGTGIDIFNFSGRVTLDKAGFGTTVAFGNAPVKPYKFSPKELQILNKDIENGKEAQNTRKPARVRREEKPEDTTPTIVENITESDAPPETDLPQIFAPVPSLDPQTPVPEDVLVAEIPVTEETVTDTTTTTTTTTTTVPTISIPTNGIEDFTGLVTGTSYNADGTTTTISSQTLINANWYNQTFAGAVVDTTSTNPGKPVFFFGTVNTDGTIANVKIIGTDSQIDTNTNIGTPSMIYGLGSTGQLSDDPTYGRIFSFNATGSSFDLATLTTQDTWEVALGGSSIGIAAGDEIAPTGTATWHGFITGLAENIADPSIGRRLYMNSNLNDITMNINKDTGTVTGSFSAVDGAGASATLSVDIGADGSAYIDDHTIVSLLRGSTTTNGTTDTFFANSNFLISEDPTKAKPASYVEWGMWEAAYKETSSSAVYDIHAPGSFWVAGVPTLAGNYQPGSFNYQGTAYATKTSSTSLEYLNGTTSFNINLTDINGGGSLSGAITMSDGYSMSMGTTSIANGSFTSALGTNGSINGAFFGPTGDSIAGNFMDNSGSALYLGIFGGDRL